MKRYKQIIYLSLILAAVMGSSCNKQLNYTPEVFLAAENVYNSQAGAISGVTGIYEQLEILKASDYALIGIIGTDEARCTYQTQGYGTYYAGITGLDVYNIDFNSQNADISGFWADCYAGIANANAAIQYIPGVSFSDTAERSRLLGEASFLRAVFYFYLVQLYGDVPLRLPGMSFSAGAPRTPAATVYKQIIADLQFAAANCWTRAKNPDVGRASIESSLALLGKVYLTIQDYADAQTAFETLINNYNISLLPNYADLFNETYENSTESLFSIQYSSNSGNTNGLANWFGFGDGPSTLNTAEPTITSPGYGGNVVIATAWYADSVWEPNDTRYLASITPEYFYANATDSSQNWSWWDDIGLQHINKYDITQGSINCYQSTKNEYYLRTADVFLMYAEVLNEQGQTSAALVPLNKVRNRAGLANLEAELGAIPNQTTMRSQIMLERTRELGGEGWRWFDLKRTGTLVTAVIQHDNPHLYYEDPSRNGPGDAHPPQDITAINNLYPIPLTELQTNSALSLASQNPGY